MNDARAVATFLLLLLIAVLPGVSDAIESPLSGRQALLSHYAKIEPMLGKSPFGMPISLVSSDDGTAADVYGVLDYPFSSVSDALALPGNWCDITLLHLNVKACVSQKKQNAWTLTLYAGRKFYQEPEDAYEIRYAYRIEAQRPDYLSLLLSAGEGPLGTSDYRIALQAVPLTGGKTLIHLSYQFRYGFWSRIVMSTYFSTAGSSKVGFSVVGTGDDGAPEYVSGPRGAVERNVVRYFFAIQAYVDALRYPKEQQFEKRIVRWFELTEKHRRQLFELERTEYISSKRREYLQQGLLQKRLGE